MMSIRYVFVLIFVLLVGNTGCRRAYDIGDHVLVEWEDDIYPAMIIEIPGPGKVRVHYDGYDDMWDESIPRSRIQGRVEGEPPTPDPPAKVRRTVVEAAKTNELKRGDRIKAEWHGRYYPAVIIGVVGPERYRIHYEGYGDEWDENVPRERLKSK